MDSADTVDPIHYDLSLIHIWVSETDRKYTIEAIEVFTSSAEKSGNKGRNGILISKLTSGQFVQKL